MGTTLEDTIKFSECVSQIDWGKPILDKTADEIFRDTETLRECIPPNDWPKVDSRKPKVEQEREAIKQIYEKWIAEVESVVRVNGPIIFPGPWTPDVTDPRNLLDVLRDMLDDPEPVVPTLPTHDFFDPIGLYPDVLRDAITHTPDRIVGSSQSSVASSNAPLGANSVFDSTLDAVKAVHAYRTEHFKEVNTLIEKGQFAPPYVWSREKPVDMLEKLRTKSKDSPASYARDSDEPWVDDIELQRLRAAVEAALPPLQRVVEGSEEMTFAARGMATAWNRDAVPALQRVVDPIHNVKGGFDRLIGGLMVTGQSSAELREELPADAEAAGDGVYHGLEPAKVGFQELTGGMSDLFDMSLKMPVVGKKLSSLL